MNRSVASVTCRVLAILTICVGASAARADDPKTLAGAWEGKLKRSQGGEIRLILRIEPGQGGAYTVALDSPDEGLFDLALDPSEAKEGKLKVGIKISRASIEGALNESGSEIVAKFTQGVSRDVTFHRVDPAKLPTATKLDVPERLVGLWEGKLVLQAGLELRVVLNVSRKADGSRTVVLDSPDQNANGLPISAISLVDGELKFESKLLRATFEGKANAEGNAYEGTFTQAGRKMPLTLKKTDKVSALIRPQEPKPPFPYDEENVAYENPAAGIKLAGTLTIPRGEGPFPAVVLITGSGPQDRNETLLGHKPFLVLADYLTRRGVAVLRVDDRGVGGSTGNIMTSTSDDFAGDALAGVAFLKGHTKIDAKKIGLCGHSEGGLIGPIAAARSDDVSFVVMMAGTGMTGAEILRLQSRLIAKAMGASDQALEVQAKILEQTFTLLARERDDEKAGTALKEISRKALEGLSAEERKSLDEVGSDEESVGASLKQMTSPWFRYFLTYDPRPTLAKVKCPVLAINGAKDLQVPPTENLAEIRKALEAGGNGDVTIVELAELNHLFQHSKTGAPAEYARIEETFAPEALKIIGDWIESRTRESEPGGAADKAG